MGRQWAKKHPTIRWNTIGASIYGEPCESGTTGYRGAYLPGSPGKHLPGGWYFAELGMGSDLGGLSSGTRIIISSPDTHRTTTVVKGDIGAGGGTVGGYTRGIDLYAPVAKWVAGASCSWTGVLRWRLAP